MPQLRAYNFGAKMSGCGAGGEQLLRSRVSVIADTIAIDIVVHNSGKKRVRGLIHLP